MFPSNALCLAHHRRGKTKLLSRGSFFLIDAGVHAVVRQVRRPVRHKSVDTVKPGIHAAPYLLVWATFLILHTTPLHLIQNFSKHIWQITFHLCTSELIFHLHHKFLELLCHLFHQHRKFNLHCFFVFLLVPEPSHIFINHHFPQIAQHFGHCHLHAYLLVHLIVHLLVHLLVHFLVHFLSISSSISLPISSYVSLSIMPIIFSIIFSTTICHCSISLSISSSISLPISSYV